LNREKRMRLSRVINKKKRRKKTWRQKCELWDYQRALQARNRNVDTYDYRKF
jgi:hypothetical protein